MDSARAAVRSLTVVADRRRPEHIGRHARLELVFGVRNGRTILSHAYAEPPLRVGRALPDGAGVHVILASAAPGAFGGDVFEQRVIVEPGAQVRLTSQSAMQAHPAVGGGVARLRSTFEVADEAELHCHWDPLIPFARSRVEQRIDIRLGSSGRLLWSDAFMAGRDGRGERWQCASLRHELRLTRNAAREYVERYRIEPADGRVRAPWAAGGCCYFGTTLASGWPVPDGAAEQLHGGLGQILALHAAADRLHPTLLLVRLAAAAGPPFHDARGLVLRSLAGRG